MIFYAFKAIFSYDFSRGLFAAGQIGQPWSMAPTKGALLICLQNPQFNAINMVRTGINFI
jgi:hypothetical protein